MGIRYFGHLVLSLLPSFTRLEWSRGVVNNARNTGRLIRWTSNRWVCLFLGRGNATGHRRSKSNSYDYAQQ